MDPHKNNRETPVPLNLIFASGYASPYKDNPSETRSAEAGTWFPSSIDFRATVTNSGGGSGASTFDELLKLIEKEGQGTISSLGLIGHAGGDNFGLGGKITVRPADVTFSTAGLIDATTISKNLKVIQSLKNRFTRDANITLFGCHTGVSTKLLDAISNALGIYVSGFSKEIIWCIDWSLPKRTITSRGKVFVDTNGQFAAGLVSCASFNKTVTSLKPDVKSSVGITPAKP
jgi:hypothetical protein